MNIKWSFGKIIAFLLGYKFKNGQIIIFDDTELFEDK